MFEMGCGGNLGHIDRLQFTCLGLNPRYLYVVIHGSKRCDLLSSCFAKYRLRAQRSVCRFANNTDSCSIAGQYPCNNHIRSYDRLMAGKPHTPLSRRMMTSTAYNTRLCSYEIPMAHKPSKSQSARLSMATTATHTHPMATDAYLTLSMEHNGKDVSLVHAKHSVVDLHCYP